MRVSENRMGESDICRQRSGGKGRGAAVTGRGVGGGRARVGGESAHRDSCRNARRGDERAHAMLALTAQCLGPTWRLRHTGSVCAGT